MLGAENPAVNLEEDAGRKPRIQRPVALALDMDGTLTTGSRPLGRELTDLLREVKRAGTKLILATGRCVKDCYDLAGQDLFDGLVAENGAVLVFGGRKLLVAPDGWAEVRRRIVANFEPGCEEVIISADRGALEVAKQVVPGAAAKIELNKDRLMILPAGIDKGTGLTKILSSMELERGLTACIGDGENDLPMFEVAGTRVALGNSVEALKQRASLCVGGSDGEGTMEAIRQLFFQGGGRPSEAGGAEG